ncbi:MAG TPA: hypothetical protein VM581_03690 [Magnetospirillaceae bacterium]|nr:hypothetical protein [Magnetospirillaceae bacterium]
MRKKQVWIVAGVAALALLLCVGIFAFSGESYTRQQQIADFQTDLRTLGFTPTDVKIEADTSAKAKLKWDKKKKKWVSKTASSDTEVEATFSFAGCTFEADRKLDAGGNPKKIEGFTVEVETAAEEREFDDVRAFRPDDIIALVNGVPTAQRPQCYNGRK